MKKEYYFTSRMVMAGCIAIATILVGYLSLTSLPIEQYPDIAPPTINVETDYTGADAASCVSSVIMPLEEEINGVEKMMYMTSSAASNGKISISVYFEQGTDADMATVNVQNRVQKAMGLLPSEVTKNGVNVSKSQNSMLQVAALKSTDGKFDERFIANYLYIHVIPQIQRIKGVGKVACFGNKYSMRVWMKPDQMSQYRLEPSDIFNAIGTQNIVSPTGSLGESSANTYQYTLEYSGRLKTIEEFNNIVIKATEDGHVIHLSDVANVELGALSYALSANVDNKPGVSYIINQAPGANATEVNTQINELYEKLKPTLPPGLEFVTIMCSNDFLFAAMHNVVETLIIAIILVILVVYLFLQSFKATIIPTISIIVSMIGTFAIVSVAGFSLNILTLFALVLAIGTVVDDAIVVVEAVMAKFESGVTNPKQATDEAMHDVFSAVLSCTLVFMAVFIPVTFMPGTSGTFFTQFGVTMAAAVGLSGLNALTLCPALCAIMLRPTGEGGEKKDFNFYVRKSYDAAYGSIFNKYQKSVQKFLKRPVLSWVGVTIALVAMFWLMSHTPADLVPQEDQGVVFVNVSTPPGYTLEQTKKVLEQVSDIIGKNEEVEHVACIAGYGLLTDYSTNAGTIFARLKNWDERKGIEHNINLVIYRIFNDCKAITEAQIIPFQMPQIPGYGNGNAIELNIQNKGNETMEQFAERAKTLTAKLSEHPEFASVFDSYDNTNPKYKVEVNSDFCERSGISVQHVLSVLGAYCGDSYVSNYNQFNKVYRVMSSASPEYRLDPSSLDNMFIRVANGNMAPLSQFVTLKKIVGSSIEKRFNLFPTIILNVSPASGVAAGEAMAIIEKVFKEEMPAEYGYEYGGMSRETAKNAGSNDTTMIYIICILCIYLIMATLYNSWFVPFAVLLSIPFGLMGAYLFTYPFVVAGLGFSNNIYLQTGVIMLIGLLSKTAILITEFASEKRHQGMSLWDSAFAACKDRLRPILMTVSCMVIGMIPLVVGSGAGAVGNRSLALGVIGGMVVGTIALIFVVPVFFMFFQKIQEKTNGIPALKQEIVGAVKTLVVIAVIALTTSCSSSNFSVWDKYQSESAISENSFGDEQFTHNLDTTSNLGEFSWRQLFLDTQLQSLIETALVNNVDMKKAQMQVQRMEIALSTAKKAFFPSLYFSPSGSISQFNDVTSKVYNFPVAAQWQLDVFGGITSSKRQKQSLLEQSKDIQQATQSQIIANVAYCYYTLLNLDQQLRVLKATEIIRKEGVVTQEALMQAGMSTSAGVSRMKASLYSVQTQIFDVEKIISQQENILCILLAEPPHHIVRSSQCDFFIPDRISIGIPAALLQNRPDVRAAERNIEAAFYGVQKANANMLPNLTLEGTLGWTNGTNGTINPGKILWNALASLTAPIFAKGQLNAARKTSIIAQEEAKQDFVKTVLNAGSEVNNAIVSCRTAYGKISLLKKQVEELQSAYDATRELMNHGSTTYLEVLDAQEALLAAQLNELSNENDGIQSVISLYIALGGGK